METLHSAVNSLLECSICLEVYRDPRNLPCGHTFCLRCLQLNDHRTCALCNRLWSLPIGGIQALPKNFALDSFISQLPKVSSAVGGLTRAAAAGHHKTGSCHDPLCALCLAVDQPVAHHDTSDGINGEEEEEDVARCTQHPEEFVTAYCNECSECVCDACIAALHADHDCVDLNEADKTIVESIKKTIADYDKTASKCRKKLRRLVKVKGGLGSEKNEVLAAISLFMSDVKTQVQAAAEQMISDMDKREAAARQVIEECAEDERERLTRVGVETEDKIRKLQQMVQLYERQLSLSLTPAHRATFLKRQSLIKRPSLKYVDDVKNIQVTNVSKWKTDVNTWMRQVVFTMTDTDSVPQLTKLTNGASDDTTPNDRQDQRDTGSTSSQGNLLTATASLSIASLSSLPSPSSNQSATSKKHSKPAHLPPSQSVPSNMQLQPQSIANEQSPVSTGCEQVTAPPPYNRSRSASATPQLSVMPPSVNQTPSSKHSGSNTSSKQKRHSQAAVTLAAAPAPPPIPARPDMRYVPYVRSAQLLRSITISQIKDNDVTMISAHKDKLLISSWGSSQLYVYHVSGQHLSTIAIPGMLFDVAWTPRGDIACTTRHNHKVIIMSQAGDVITQTDMTNPQCLSVSSDDVMYLADWQNGVYQSTDGGAAWNQTFQTREGVQCWQVVKMAAGGGGQQQQQATPDVYWTLERKDTKYRLCAFSRNADNSVVWRDVSLPKVPEAPISLASSRMVHDGLSSVLLTDQHNSAIHVLTTAGQYLAPLLTADHLAGTPWRLAVDRTTRTLYVGLQRGEVKVFALLS